jgi:hypothetical protein
MLLLRDGYLVDYVRASGARETGPATAGDGIDPVQAQGAVRARIGGTVVVVSLRTRMAHNGRPCSAS